jgi:hypothetical protein
MALVALIVADETYTSTAPQSSARAVAPLVPTKEPDEAPATASTLFAAGEPLTSTPLFAPASVTL